MAPVFPSVELLVSDEAADGFEGAEIIETGAWGHLAWGPELMRLDVGVLFCSGIDQFLCGALLGYGIEVVSDVVGMPDELIDKWRKGMLPAGNAWPNASGCRGQNRCRRRARGNK